MNFSIHNYFFFIVGIFFLLIQSRWFFINKKQPDYYWQVYGRSKKAQDIRWTFFGILFIVGIILVTSSFESFVIGVITSLVLCVAVLPLFWGLLL